MSMTRKEAIKVLKNGGIEVCGEADRISEFIAALDVALDALIPPTRENELEAENRDLKERIVNWRNYMTPTREQVERMRREWTHTHSTDNFWTEVLKCSYCGFEDDHGCCFDFCPDCGTPMTDEAVDIELRRWREAVGNA